MNIIETFTESGSAQKQLEVHLARMQKYRDEGYPCIQQPDGSWWVYPKNAETGEPNMDATPTKLWAEPVETPDATFAIPLPVDVEPEFSGDFTVRRRPDEWDVPEE